ncbi:unnamed protein product [Polarella glacialis]|uniref:Uncharacterized protein n=1 Tax=Polarella glacialis TaxID=89957 RepID=A0A813FWR7_POLGL|nr:unnamed protein product [Polarella glacialis]
MAAEEVGSWRLLNPLSIRFSQPRIAPHFRDGHLLQDTVSEVFEAQLEDPQRHFSRLQDAAEGAPPYDLVLVPPFPAIRVISWLPKIRRPDGISELLGTFRELVGDLPYLEAQAALAAAKVVAARAAQAATQSEALRAEERARLAIEAACADPNFKRSQAVEADRKAELARASYQRQQAQGLGARPAKAVPKAQPVLVFETPGAAFNLLGKGGGGCSSSASNLAGGSCSSASVSGPPPRRPFLPDCSDVVQIPEPEPDLGQGKGKRVYSEVLQTPAKSFEREGNGGRKDGCF